MRGLKHQGAEVVQPGEAKAKGEPKAATATWRGVTKVMETNPSQKGAAATSCGLGRPHWTLGNYLPAGGWCSSGTDHPGCLWVLPPEELTGFGWTKLTWHGIGWCPTILLRAEKSSAPLLWTSGVIIPPSSSILLLAPSPVLLHIWTAAEMCLLSSYCSYWAGKIDAEGVWHWFNSRFSLNKKKKANLFFLSALERLETCQVFFGDTRFAFRKLRSSGSWHTGICVCVWFAWSCCSKFLNMEELEKCISFFFFFNRHSYTNLKIVNWGKVSITEHDVKKIHR